MKKELSIGLDIGGTKILGILYDHQLGKTYGAYRQPVVKANHLQLVQQISEEVKRLIILAQRKSCSVKNIGIGLPGIIKEDKIINCPNLGILNNQRLGQQLKKLWPDHNIAIDNDVNCFLRAYLNKHPQLQKTTCAVIALGTGIGGAIAVNGQNITQVLGVSSEFGHMIINHKNKYSLENYYHKILKQPAGKTFTSAQNGNQSAQKKVNQFAQLLGIALANLNNLVSPQVIILTGGVIRYHKNYLPLVKQVVNIYSQTANRPRWTIGHDQTAAAVGASLILEQIN